MLIRSSWHWRIWEGQCVEALWVLTCRRLNYHKISGCLTTGSCDNIQDWREQTVTCGEKSDLCWCLLIGEHDAAASVLSLSGSVWVNCSLHLKVQVRFSRGPSFGKSCRITMGHCCQDVRPKPRGWMSDGRNVYWSNTIIGKLFYVAIPTPDS